MNAPANPHAARWTRPTGTPHSTPHYSHPVLTNHPLYHLSQLTPCYLATLPAGFSSPRDLRRASPRLRSGLQPRFQSTRCQKIVVRRAYHTQLVLVVELASTGWLLVQEKSDVGAKILYSAVISKKVKLALEEVSRILAYIIPTY